MLLRDLASAHVLAHLMLSQRDIFMYVCLPLEGQLPVGQDFTALTAAPAMPPVAPATQHMQDTRFLTEHLPQLTPLGGTHSHGPGLSHTQLRGSEPETHTSLGVCAGVSGL